MQVAVAGASGFIGSNVVNRLSRHGVEVKRIASPRLQADPDWVTEESWRAHTTLATDLAQEVSGCVALINCAGDPNASARATRSMFGANSVLPGVLADAATIASVPRFVHVSSAAVQGNVPSLDATATTRTFSPYSRSKALGESAVRDAYHGGTTQFTIFRPPSVHGPQRRVTKSILRLARSPLASVIGDGEAHTPQAHIDNVAEAITYLALTDKEPPAWVIYPSEGWTTGELMRAFGYGREPFHIPVQIAPFLRGLLACLQRVDALSANARRVEMMWFGQRQEESWLTRAGWYPPVGRTEWRAMFCSAGTGTD